LGARMWQIVTDMGEKGALRRQFLNVLNRSLDGGMRGMRRVTQRIQKQNVQAVQLRERFGRNLAVIGQVGRISETKPEDWRFPVKQPHRHHLQPEQLEGFASKYVRLQLRDHSFAAAAVKDVLE